MSELRSNPFIPSARSLVVSATLGSMFLSGCATNRFSRNESCALIGAGLGAAAGIIYTINEDYNGGEVAAGTAIGGAAGAALGYGICAIVDR